MFLGVNHAHAKGAGPASTCAGTVWMRNDNQILHGDQTRRKRIFYRVYLPRILTRDLFVVANLLVSSCGRLLSVELCGNRFHQLY